MKSFEYAAPKTVKEAAALLGEKWGETEILAGGTDLITLMKQGVTAPKRVVSLKNIPELRGIQAEGGALRIGAMTRLGELAASKEAREHFPSLVSAVRNIGSDQILSTGTAGGDLCQRPRCWYFRNGMGFADSDGKSRAREGDNRYHAIFGTDANALFVSPSSLAPALVALGAVFTVEGPKGRPRQVAAAEFFRAPKNESEREYALAPNEILSSISIPIRGMRNAIYEVRHRHGLDWPYVAAAVAYSERNGTVAEASVVLGHVAATPWVAREAANLLRNTRLDASVAERCGEAAAGGAKPLSKNGYKVQLVKAAVKRALLAAQGA